uniref:Uncharacterized protein n=1 Tax=Phasianus colchicus TaxID=9054 RepID=A0A669QTC3_PHACC
MLGTRPRCRQSCRKQAGSSCTRRRHSPSSAAESDCSAGSDGAGPFPSRGPPPGASRSIPASSKVSRIAQIRKATSPGSGEPSCCRSVAKSGARLLPGGGGRTAPSPQRGEAGSSRSHSAEKSAASTRPPGKTCALGMKPLRELRYSDRRSGLPAASSTEAASLQCRSLGFILGRWEAHRVCLQQDKKCVELLVASRPRSVRVVLKGQRLQPRESAQGQEPRAPICNRSTASDRGWPRGNPHICVSR